MSKKFLINILKQILHHNLFLKKIAIIMINKKNKVSKYIELQIRLLGFKRFSKRKLIDSIAFNIKNKKGYAVAKLGTSEHQFIGYPIHKNNIMKMDIDINQCMNSFSKNAGCFPATDEFIVAYSSFFVKSLNNIDCLGYFQIPVQLKLLKYYRFNNALISYNKQEPDRSVPSNDSMCYLKHLRGKKILLINPFARFLAERANKETFENVWKKTGKKWFYPESVEGIEFPYGLSKKTQEQYDTVFNLIDEIKEKISKKDFDVAFIAAGGIAIPLASYIKDLGKVSISLGGHLQVLFGVLGERWRGREDWKNRYFNEYWVNLPEKYIPEEKEECENSSYW